MTATENSTDPAFEAWLRAVTTQGYDRDWVRRNRSALRQRYEQTDGAPMPPAPAPPTKRYDRYEEL